MTKLAFAAAAALVVSAAALPGSAAAQDWNGGLVPIGEKGARWGSQCWVDTSGGGYFGYWAPCPGAAAAPKKITNGR
jgi:hypothetical protein